MTLLETYAKRLNVADTYFGSKHQGRKMSNATKIAVAQCLQNTSKFMNESFENSVGTQRTAIGDYKKFALDLTTLTLPNLIANELVLVKPMSSFGGYAVYMNFVAGSNKGIVSQGDLFNGTFGLGQMTTAEGGRVDYTGSRVVDRMTGDGTTTSFTLAWKPVAGSVVVKVGGVETQVTVNGDTITFAQAPAADAAIVVGYVYDNVYIPQNDLPILNAVLDKVELTARARRIAIYYSNIASFQAKNDYGMDLGAQLADQAIGELSYEIDTEVVSMLSNAAAEDAQLVFSKTLPVGVSKTEHYQGFVEVVEQARAIVYQRTGKFAPNYMVVAADVIPVLSFIRGWDATPINTFKGPYMAGTLNGLKVFVHPSMESGKFFLGVNDGDKVAAGIYAPYMPIVPTQLLGFADGAMSQGFSTLYDCKPLAVDNQGKSALLVAGKIVA